jgi:hypothetical protein
MLANADEQLRGVVDRVVDRAAIDRMREACSTRIASGRVQPLAANLDVDHRRKRSRTARACRTRTGERRRDRLDVRRRILIGTERRLNLETGEPRAAREQDLDGLTLRSRGWLWRSRSAIATEVADERDREHAAHDYGASCSWQLVSPAWVTVHT